MNVLAHDVDAHEMIPSHLMGEAFGEPGRMLGELFAITDKLRPDPTATNMHQPTVQDTMAVDRDNIWKVKGPGAPSAIDFKRRIEVMDVMGIDRQLVFPTSAIAAMIIGGMTDFGFEQRFGGDVSMFGNLTRSQFADRFVAAYNDWALTNSAIDNRVRMVSIIPTRDNVNEMIGAAADLVRRGVRAVYLQADVPPGGVSPAHSSLDPMWALFEDNNVAVTLHIGSSSSSSIRGGASPRRSPTSSSLPRSPTPTSRCSRRPIWRSRTTFRRWSWAACSSAFRGCVSV
jgi:hypothetical protein